MGTSLACGFQHKSLENFDGVLVMLADMPDITADHINKLLVAFASGDSTVVRGLRSGKARAFLQRQLVPVQMIDIGFAGLRDSDTADELVSAGGRIRANEMSG